MIDTIVAKDHDSVVMVILRVGIAFGLLFSLIVLAHHAMTRKK